MGGTLWPVYRTEETGTELGAAKAGFFFFPTWIEHPFLFLISLSFVYTCHNIIIYIYCVNLVASKFFLVSIDSSFYRLPNKITYITQLQNLLIIDPMMLHIKCKPDIYFLILRLLTLIQYGVLPPRMKLQIRRNTVHLLMNNTPILILINLMTSHQGSIELQTRSKHMNWYVLL